MIRAALALILAAAPAIAQNAERAFSEGDYGTARAIWQEAAAEGDADAAFGLGVLNDLGLGGSRDPARAFRYYLTAADAGHPEAQFNVAVMIDAGTVRDPDPVAAAVWYARAAANGVPRAAYNLGVLYKEGIGVPPNAALARYWLSEAASSVPAAADTLETVTDPADPEDLPRPMMQGDFLVPSGEGMARAELVWTSPPAADSLPFVVELLQMPEEEGAAPEITRRETPASALAIELPAGSRYAWRVLRLAADGGSYAAADWSALSASLPDGEIPAGLVTLAFGRQDDDARRLAESLRPILEASGYAVALRPEEETAETSAVRYGYPTDAAMAEGVASVLPSVAPAEAGDAEIAPGEVRVTLAGGLAPPTD